MRGISPAAMPPRSGSPSTARWRSIRDAENQRRPQSLRRIGTRDFAGRARGTRRATVRHTPQRSGMPNSSWSAIAAPSTSARSQAAMAISQMIQSTNVVRREYASRHACARSRPLRDAKARRQRLQQNRHQVRQHDHGEQRVAEPRAAGDVGGPVARVHVADGYQIARSGEGQHLSPEARRPVGIGMVPWTSGRLRREGGPQDRLGRSGDDLCSDPSRLAIL